MQAKESFGEGTFWFDSIAAPILQLAHNPRWHEIEMVRTLPWLL